jgi:EAL domain-containing protein (putative c-di-GMP-specific phosphodiesterase class I)
MLKLSAELTAEAMRERFPRALLSACTHIARVLGIHCIAKRVDTAAAGRWLAVAGVDYLDPFSPAETGAATTTDEAVVLQLVS